MISRTRLWRRASLSLLLAAAAAAVACDGRAAPPIDDVSWVTVFAEAALAEAGKEDESDFAAWPEEVSVHVGTAVGLEHLRTGLEQVAGYLAGDFPSFFFEDEPRRERNDVWGVVLDEVLVDAEMRKGVRLAVPFRSHMGFHLRHRRALGRA